jgi:hypothetical protein
VNSAAPIATPSSNRRVTSTTTETIGERDWHDGDKDHKLVRHGWWLLDNLADAACCSARKWAQPHPGLEKRPVRARSQN